MRQIKLENWHEPATVSSDFVYDMAMAHNEKWWATFYKGRVSNIYTNSKICRKNVKGTLNRIRYKGFEKVTLAQVAFGKYDRLLDHIDRNPLNNLIDNLRTCTQSENNANKPKNKNCTSKFKGVSWNKVNSCWVVHIRRGGKLSYLGKFTDEVAAAIVYNKAALDYFGEFAIINLNC